VKLDKLALIERVLKLLGSSALPNLSNSIGIAKLRYIQSIYEPSACRNPDTFVGDLLPLPIRWASLLQGKLQLSKLRLRPFYYYLIARTKYYDKIFTDAIAGNIDWIVNVGSGSDTRAYRFAADLNRTKKHVIECDQNQSIFIKQKLAGKKWCNRHVIYMPIDINDESWSKLESALNEIKTPVLFIMEGVSPYVNGEAFRRFLKFISVTTSSGSRVAYDFRIHAASENPDQNEVNRGLFRLSANEDQILGYHELLGYKLQNFESSSELTSRMLPNIAPPAGFFTDDCLLELLVK
jgi:methyltransferase (TIGR00027 family)